MAVLGGAKSPISERAEFDGSLGRVTDQARIAAIVMRPLHLDVQCGNVQTSPKLEPTGYTTDVLQVVLQEKDSSMPTTQSGAPFPTRVGDDRASRSVLHRSAGQVWVLVDLPNWLGGMELDQRTYPRTRLVLRAVATCLRSTLWNSARSPLNVRLYSSWHTPDGHPTYYLRNVGGILEALERDLQSVWLGRTYVSVAESIASVPTFAAGYRRSGKQKLVDTHIVADAIFLAWRSITDEVVVASSDADMIPGLLTAAAIRRRLARNHPSPLWITADADVPRVATRAQASSYIRLNVIS